MAEEHERQTATASAPAHKPSAVKRANEQQHQRVGVKKRATVVVSFAHDDLVISSKYPLGPSATTAARSGQFAASTLFTCCVIE